LSRFFSQPGGQAFYLTGGGALSEYYLQHRFSQDLDLFTQSQSAFEQSEKDLRSAAQEVKAKHIRFQAMQAGDNLSRCFLSLSSEPEIKIDVVHDFPPYFGEVVLQEDGVRVDSLDNLAVENCWQFLDEHILEISLICISC